MITNKMVCEAHQQFHNSLIFTIFPVFPCELLQQWTGESEEICYKAMEKAEKEGYLEYGTSLNSAWLTSKGKELIKEKEGAL